MARKNPPRWCRRTAGAAVALTAMIGGVAVVSSTGSARASQGTGAPEDRIVICESGVVDHGDGVETSSARAVRVPVGTPVPAGCRDG